MPNIEPLVVPINGAARALSIDRATIYRMIARGELRPVKIGSRQMIPVAQLQALAQPAAA